MNGHTKFRVNPIDASFLRLDSPKTRQIIATVWLVDGSPSIDVIRARMLSAVSRFRRLKCRVVEERGILWWEQDPGFSIDRHFCALSYCASIDGDLEMSISKVLSLGFPSDRPPWQLVVISPDSEGCAGDPKNPSAVMIYGHHAFADGISGIELHRSLADRSDLPCDDASVFLGHNTQSASTYHVPSLAFDSVFSLATLKHLKKELFAKRAASCLNGENSTQRAVRFVDLPLRDLKLIKQKLRVGVHEILLSLIAGAVEQYGTNNDDHSVVPRDRGHLRVLVPINLRASDERCELGNHLTGACLDIPLQSLNTLERTLHIQRTISRMQKDGSFSVYGAIGKLLFKLPTFMQTKLYCAQAEKTNLICSAIPGSRKIERVNGLPILSHYGMPVPMSGHGLAVGFLTYSQKVCLCLHYDPILLPDPSAFQNSIEREMTQLFELAMAGG